MYDNALFYKLGRNVIVVILLKTGMRFCMNQWEIAKKNFIRMNFDKKMQVFLGVVIGIVMAICLIVSGVIFNNSMRSRAEVFSQSELDTMATTFGNSLESYKSITWALMMDEDIKYYLHKDELSGLDYVEATNRAKNTITSILNLQNNIHFISIVPENMDSYIYRSATIGLATSNFIEMYEDDYEAGIQSGKGTIKINYSNAYFKNERYSLNLYIPLYDTEHMVNELGLLCMSVEDGVVEQVLKREDQVLNSDVYLMTGDKKIVASSGGAMEIEEELRLKGMSGSCQTSNMIYYFQKVKNWDYYFVTAISKSTLYRDSYGGIAVITLFIIFLTGIFFFISNRLVSKEYRPLEEVVQNMEQVSNGNLTIRATEDKMGEDFRILAHGFNSMMDRIESLMEQVVTEQHQMDQIKFNALQSQIQPHFLYNALDCIHWQALSEGDRETSELIKALANYYRIFLSGGQDIIELSKEIEHIRNYLLIQNLRYDNIIESDIVVEDQYRSCKLPKLTLQPLIENSIYHGIKSKEGRKGKVRIRVTRQEEDIYILVEDNGTGMSEEEVEEMNRNLSKHEDATGYGVRNVNKRIELLFGQEYGLRYERNESGGISVWIRMPMKAEILYKGVL